MKKTYLVILFCIGALMPAWSQDTWQQANDAYSREEYEQAISLYQQLQAEEGSAVTLYYNLGNACYKAKRYPEAILNYERALLLSPGNADVHFNLEMAKSHITDKIEPVGTFFLTMWIHSVRDKLSSNSWALFGVICFLLFIAGASLYFFTRRTRWRKLGFFAGWICLFLSLMGNVFAASQKARLEARDEAIVFSPSVTVKSSPAESGTDLFVLHEGTKVKVLSTIGEWSEILIEDGNRGWMPTAGIEII